MVALAAVTAIVLLFARGSGEPGFTGAETEVLTEYAERHPDLAEEIRELFPALVEMEQLKPVSADCTGAFVADIEASDPDRIGEFRILRRVGYGGMGVVYEAMQESLGRHVALKVLPAETLIDPKRRLATAKHHARRARFVPGRWALLSGFAQAHGEAPGELSIDAPGHPGRCFLSRQPQGDRNDVHLGNRRQRIREVIGQL